MKKQNTSVDTVPGIGRVIRQKVLETLNHKGIEFFLAETIRGGRYQAFSNEKVLFTVSSTTKEGARVKARNCIDQYFRYVEQDAAFRTKRAHKK